MTKKYIKRQVVLNDLGVPMDENIKEYYEYFNELLDNLEEIVHYDLFGNVIYNI